MFGGINQVGDVVEVGFVIIKLFRRTGFEEAAGNLVGIARFVIIFPSNCPFHEMHIFQVLPVRGERRVVLMIGIALTAQNPSAVVPLIRRAAPAEVVARIQIRVRTQENGALKVVRNLAPRQTHPGFRHVDKAHDTIHSRVCCSGWPQVAPLVGNTNNQRTVNTAGIEESFTAWQHAAVV